MSLVPYVHLDTSLTDLEVGARVAVPEDAVHHLTRVLRLADGAPVVASDGQGAEVAATLDGAHLELTGPVTTTPPPHPHLTVLQGLPRGRKLDEVVRQVTELGVDRIVPVACARSVTRLEGTKADRAVRRWQAVARSAAEQARRPWRATVTAVVPAARAAAAVPPGTLILVAHVGADTSLPAAVAARAARPDAVAVAVGPEGGWHDDEVATFVAAGAIPVGLGPSVLRTEHAAAAAVAVLAAVGGRWDVRPAERSGEQPPTGPRG